ncbi:restriction endonuclease [Enterococcus cecorum]|uniref:restriction endonuclease n=1 Tax=Enterococcus cecorum TaxID=44008 RepID=UPI003267EEC4
MDNNDIKIIEDFNKWRSDHGVTMPELVTMIGTTNSSTLFLTEEHAKRFTKLLNSIERHNCSKKEKGKILEELINYLFTECHSKILDCRLNQRTSTNEIDLLLSWTEEARFSSFTNLLPVFVNSFLCECKNYNGKVGVTYIGKFYSLLKVSNSKLGILISWEGVTGRNDWTDAKGLIKKIALKDDIYIIALDKNDLYEIGNRKTHIFNIVNKKYTSLQNDIDYSKYINPHENEELFSSL